MEESEKQTAHLKFATAPRLSKQTNPCMTT